MPLGISGFLKIINKLVALIEKTEGAKTCTGTIQKMIMIVL